ncbi:MAG TPA: sugar ABC transporter ATP-binding protein [Vicinamibacterales bacterium]|nr:sugar ABC transporter ATP-binding protein [Vicinamibacterales bacterium]
MTAASQGLRFTDVRKSFGAVRALRGVSFAVAEGEAHGLMGENGAGKSTLLKILAGIVQPDGGDVHWRGERLHLGSPRDALERGIGMVYQEMLCFENLTVAGNIFAGREIVRRGRLRDQEMRERTRALLDELHLPISPDAPASSLSAAYRQLLQVARALAFDCQILVLDEPTTALTDAETDHLFAVLARLKARGTTLLYVSHRLPEVFRLCDRITVLRDGSYVNTFVKGAVTPDDVVRAMVGRELPPRAVMAARTRDEQRPPALSVDGLGRRPCFRNVSLRVHAGEIVGLFGLVGSGRSELLETIFGLYRREAGTIKIDGVPIDPASPADAARAGIALVPEERQRQGLLFNLTIRHNLVLPDRTVKREVLIRTASERREAQALVESWRIKAAGVEVPPDSLSGGNQQKVVVAKWLATSPRVLLLDEPTKGVDVGAKFEIHEIIRREAARGAACLVASSDLPEVLALADRIVVMREGGIQGQIAGAEATEESVMQLATHESAAG